MFFLQAWMVMRDQSFASPLQHDLGQIHLMLDHVAKKNPNIKSVAEDIQNTLKTIKGFGSACSHESLYGSLEHLTLVSTSIRFRARVMACCVSSIVRAYLCCVVSCSVVSCPAVPLYIVRVVLCRVRRTESCRVLCCPVVPCGVVSYRVVLPSCLVSCRT